MRDLNLAIIYVKRRIEDGVQMSEALSELSSVTEEEAAVIRAIIRWERKNA